MDGTWRRGLLAAAVGLGVLAGLARAQEPALADPSPAAVGESLAPSNPATPGCAAPEERPQPRRLHAFAQRLNFRCWSNVHEMGCGSCRADTVFAFGSCRRFFGEPCLDTPAVPSLPVSVLVRRAQLDPRNAVSGDGAPQSTGHCPWCR
jgi:hypothetical protein